MRIDELLSIFLPDKKNEIRRHIDEIIEIKRESMELAVIDRSAILENYLISRLSELSNFSPEKSAKEALGSFDRIFKETLEMFS